VIGVASLLVSVIALRFATQAQHQADTDVTSVAARLAVAVGKAETEARRQLLGDHDRIIDVKFTFQPAPAHNASGAAATGRLRQVVDYYRELKPRRLVITGAPGAGKTVLAVELVLRLLAGRASDEPVPVRLSAGLLDPGQPYQFALAGWLTGHLTQTYQVSIEAARALVDAGMVLPVVDGLDEMDATDKPGYASRAAQTIRACNAYLQAGEKAGLVLTCRIEQYEALEGAHEWVRDAARVEIRPVTLSKARSFLVARTDDEDRWKPVLEAMRRGGNQPLGQALSTPWRLALAATVYEQRNVATGHYLRKPAALVDPSLDTEDKIRDHLLELFIPTVVGLHGDLYPAALVHRWLATMAQYLRNNSGTSAAPSRTLAGRALSGTDLMLHELWPLAGTRLPRLLVIALVILAWASACAYMLTHIPFHSLPDQIFGIGVPTVSAVGVAYVSWANVWPSPTRVDLRLLRTRNGRRNFLSHLMAGLTRGLGLGLAGGLAVGVVLAPAAGLVIGFFYGLAYGLFGGIEAGILLGVTFAVVFGLTVGIVGGLSYGLLSGLLNGLTRTEYAPADPRDALRSSIMAALVNGTVVGIASGLVFGLALGLTGGVVLGVAAAIAAGVAAEPIGWRYTAFLLCTRSWTQQWLPRRLGPFLDWCYDTGLLRIAGASYQFRHRELQGYLASKPEPEV